MKVKAVTFGYREGLLLHQWAQKHTSLLSVVVPVSRPDSDIQNWAIDNCLPLISHSANRDTELIDTIKHLAPDLILVHCYTYRLPDAVLVVPRLGAINIHPGRLPGYRGKDPIKAALERGDAEIWASLHYMNEGYDTGSVIATRPVVALESKDMPIGLLRERVTLGALMLLEDLWDEISRGVIDAIPQWRLGA